MDLRPFKYKSLTSPDSIRLLLIQPSPSDTASVSCNLQHTTITQCSNEIIDHYTALSYVWGDATNRKIITVDGQPISITATLEAAIRDLRDENRILRIWADALCINQSDIDERNQQVSMMGQIYSTAHHTVIHLIPTSSAATRVLKAVLGNGQVEGDDDSLQGTEDVAHLAEKEIISLPWFSRVWIFQELVLSKDPWIKIGSLRARWTDFCNLLIPLSSSLTRRGDRLELVREMNNTRGGRSGGTLLNLLLSRRGLGATDPRDMVFAHMGITSDKRDWNSMIEVDYRKTCAEVYHEAGRYLLGSVGPEAFFTYLDTAGASERQQGLASWSPDWSLKGSYEVPMYRDNLVTVERLDANCYYSFIGEGDKRVLAWMGYVVDVVDEVSLPLPPFGEMMAAERTQYQDTVRDLTTLYARVGGSYWTGDENGQYVNVSLRGNEDEHERLCRRIGDEWIKIMKVQLPSSLSDSNIDMSKSESNRSFVGGFKPWLDKKAKECKIFIGNDSKGLISLLFRHLVPTLDYSVLDRRCLALTLSGNIAVVPSQTRSGDVIAYLAGSPVAVVLRRDSTKNQSPNASWTSRDAESGSLERTIREEFEAKDEQGWKGDSYASSFKDVFENVQLEVGHYTMLGEGYLDGSVGWARGREHDHGIFALH